MRKRYQFRNNSWIWNS